MSSIKRDVKKKAPPRPEPRFFLESAIFKHFRTVDSVGLSLDEKEIVPTQ
jgi:hypothetical protein